MDKIIDKIFDIKSEENFKNICFEIFNFQMDYNPIYSAYSEIILKGKDPNKLAEIFLFLPISFFKEEQIICQGQKIEEIFLSKRTSATKSLHLVSDLSIYKKSFRKAFELFYGDIKDYCILSLLPNYREREGSSLIYMVDNLIKNSQYPESGFYLNDYQKLSQTLSKLEKEKKKTILFGVSYALLDLAEQFPQKLNSTIIIETGGTKGKEKNILKRSYIKY